MEVLKLETFTGYKNIANPDWFKRMCRNLHKIKHYQWHVEQSWGGRFWQRVQLKRVIQKLKTDNRRILEREFPKEHFPKEQYSFIFDMWKDRRGKRVPLLEIWQTTKDSK